MAFKTILLPIRESSTADSLMETAISMAVRNDGHLDLLYVKKETEHMIPFSNMGISASMRKTIIESANASAEKESEALKQRFAEICQRYSVPIQPRDAGYGNVSADFLERTGQRDELIGRYGRLADLIIVPQPVKTTPPPSSFEAALRESGRPVLMTQRNVVLDIPGKRLAIGWNSSKEAAQAISSMLGNLKRADKVFVLSSEDRMKQPMNAEDACIYLRRHGVSAEPVLFNSRNMSAGEALLAKAGEMECDRLVVGGYSRPKLRNIIMGSTTGHLLAHARIPVIFVH
jgi:nucleotide-binding universal stress UspA family protein